MKLTGTFLDEITSDIASANWGNEEWTKEFDTMKASGIDTVVMIRIGHKDIPAFPSKTLGKYLRAIPAYEDKCGFFLKQAERCGMDFYIGTYDTRCFWERGEYQKEIDLNKDIMDEFFEKHGKSPALKGWYMSIEIAIYNDSAMKVYENLAGHLKKLKKMPILISPGMLGPKQGYDQLYADPLTVEQHTKEWEKTFSRLKGIVDIVAFQDGHVEFANLPDFLKVNAELAKKNGFRCWSNVETFDRDTKLRFPPISWQKLRYKMESAITSGVEKLITFEFSHFLSPNSIYNESSKGLYNKYMEWNKK